MNAVGKGAWLCELYNTVGPRWQFPIGTNGTEPILWGRMVQFGGELTF